MMSLTTAPADLDGPCSRVSKNYARDNGPWTGSVYTPFVTVAYHHWSSQCTRRPLSTCPTFLFLFLINETPLCRSELLHSRTGSFRFKLFNSAI